MIASHSTPKAMIVSSDGHATAKMADWRPYLPANQREEFDAFLEVYRERGSRNFEPRALRARLDPEVVDQWERDFIETGRLDGDADPQQRLAQIDAEGITAEVLFPDFGLPFELVGGTVAPGAGRRVVRTPQQVEDGNNAFNQWLVDFVSAAPERWAGMASLSFEDVDVTVAEIRRLHGLGLKGIVLPHFDDDVPVFHPRFEPVWSLLEELDMPANCHTGISSITKRRPQLPACAHPAAAQPIIVPQVNFITQQLLAHLIWGGVLERHPRLKVAFTEMGTGWVVAALRGMDHSWERGYLRRDVREVVPMRPSDYFARQCFMGSSIYSRAEIAARHEIGINKMMLGMDYPHHEGTFLGGTLNYLQATLGDEQVPEQEARLLMGQTAIAVFGFNADALESIANRVGPSLDEVLTVPEVDKFLRGDVHKPML